MKKFLVIFVMCTWVLLYIPTVGLAAQNNDAAGADETDLSEQKRTIIEIMALLEMMDMLERLEMMEEMDRIQEDTNHEDDD